MTSKLKKTKSQKSKLRIIGGDWRRRVIEFTVMEGLRPTPDRVRETLFNWLSPVIQGANCLDLYAGSGVLGLESLSRNANSAVFVEDNRQTAEQLKHQATKLESDKAIIYQQDVRSFLKHERNRFTCLFDIVFIDPPYASQLVINTCALLAQYNWLKNNALVYFESNENITAAQLPDRWMIKKEKKAGAVNYYLACSEQVGDRGQI